MEWIAPAIVLGTRPYGEGDLVAAVLTEEYGAYHGFARGGASRKQSGVWQPGNVLAVRWVARLAEQLGGMSGELVYPAAALAMDDPLALATLAAACALAEAALPERVAHPSLFTGLMEVITRVDVGVVAELIRWELALLADLGYGLDLSRCTVSGAKTGLAFVSPRTGRAVTAVAGREWRERLLILPRFLAEGGEGDPSEWRDGLRLTGHFLARDALGTHHRPLPAPRRRLYDLVAQMADESTCRTT